MSPPHMSKPPKLRFRHLFFNRLYLTLSNAIISNPTFSSLSTRPTQFSSHLYLVYVCVGFLRRFLWSQAIQLHNLCGIQL